jgi:hypothetical protein
MKKLTLALVLVCFVFGCAASGPQTGGSSGSSVQKARKVPHNFDDVWPAVLETLNNQGWPIAVADKQGGRITTEFIEIGFDEINDWAGCPMGMDVQIMRGRMKVEVTLVRQSMYESTMAAAVSIHGWDDGASKMWKNCDSKGKVEDLLYEGVNKRLSIR